MPDPPDMSPPPATHPWVTAGQNRVRFGVAYGPQIAPRADWPALVGFVQNAESLGFDSYWTADHPAVWPECWMTLALLAAQTKTIRLGPLVSCVAYRSILRSHWAGPVVVAPTPEAVRAKLDRLPAPLLELFRTSAITGTPAEVRDPYRALVAAGMQYCIAVVIGDDRETLQLLAEQVIPALQGDIPT